MEPHGPNAIVQNSEDTHQHNKVASAMAQIQTLNTGPACISIRDSPLPKWTLVKGRAGSLSTFILAKEAPSVITSPSCCPSYKGSGTVGLPHSPGNLGSSKKCNTPLSASSQNSFTPFSIITVPEFNSDSKSNHNSTYSNSRNAKLSSKEYNMQSVNICRLVLVDSLSYKGTVNINDIRLLSSFFSTSHLYATFTLFCIPQSINQHRYPSVTCCSLNDTTEQNKSVINKMGINGACPTVLSENFDQNKCIDKYDDATLVVSHFVHVEEPNIPEVNGDDAIQKIKSENTITSFTRPLNCGQPDTNKSDYAFNSIIINILSSTHESELLSGIASIRKNIKSKKNVSTSIELLPSNTNDMRYIDNDFKEVTNNFTDLTKQSALSFSDLLELQRTERSRIQKLLNNEKDNQHGRVNNASWGIPRALRLPGGGESSLNTGTTGWGSPPGPNSNANSGNWGSNPTGQGGPPPQWGSNNTQSGPQRPPTSQADNNSNKPNPTQGNQPPATAANINTQANPQSWNNASGQPGGPLGSSKSVISAPISNAPTNNGSNGNGNNVPSQSNNGNTTPGGPPPGPAGSNNSTKNQLEQLNTMREALFSQDGWGGQHVNQDTNWDVPGSPEPPGPKADPAGGPPVWKPNINNGTDLWEANLRNGGQPPPQPVQKTPWGHTPTTNLGGTWGEDDDPSDSSNVWTGGPSAQPPQWNAPQSGMWGAKKENDWSGGGGASGSWVDPRGMDPREQMRGMGGDPRDMRAGSGEGRDMRGGIMIDPREQQIRGMNDPRNPMADMRGDPRGISGRLNGSSEMWNHHMGHQMPPNKMVSSGGNGQWTTGPPPKDMGMGTKPSGWEEPSPPAQRRNMPNFDDGTSLWSQQQGRMSGVSHWKELGPTGGGGMGRGMACGPSGIAPNRMPGGSTGGMKPDAMWGHNSGRNNASWEDGPHNWDEKSGGWSDGPINPGWGGVGPKGAAKSSMSGWGDTDMGEWGHAPPKQNPAQKLSKEAIWSSKQFRVLVELGFKKEDVEQALRSREMNYEEAMELLAQVRSGSGNMDTWGRHREETGPFDHNNGAFPNNRFPQPNMPFPPGNGPNLLNNMGTGGGPSSNPTLPSLNSMSPAYAQKILNQGPSGPGGSQPNNQPFNQSSSQGSSTPSTQQLRMLVQQIQMAVQAGYLNHQILNQPLAPQTLILLNQLLQQIKTLQQLAQQHSVMGGPLGRNSNAGLHISVQITKTKQQIQNLQNQIAAQQAEYVKQQSSSVRHMGGGGTPSDFFKGVTGGPGLGHDPMGGLQGNFSDMSLNKDPVATSQQSRLNQWKLPALDKEVDGDFSRAPGTSKAPNTSPNMNPLGLQGDGTWSTGRSVGDGWPSDAGGDLTDGKDWPVAAQASPAFTDLVPEFEPGKPWKGNQLKSIEDDPSITPGSVVRSPLSLASIKDPEIFTSSKTSPTSAADLQPLSLSSSTWSFNPPATQSSFTSSLGKIGSKSSWSDSAPPPTATTSELWGAPMGKVRGPPPGLGNKSVSAGNGWSGLGSRGGSNSATNWSAGNNWQSTWLLLKNLTAQIDGSTLKTLCCQHGPLHSFHLYLTHGIALAKYSTREEASKAQTALNNCVLGNTTIFAESPADAEVHAILQQLGHGAPQPPHQAAQGSWRPPNQPPAKQTGSDTWGSGSVWPPSGGGPSLWASPLDGGADQRGTPSSLNSFLPGDLLGGESM